MYCIRGGTAKGGGSAKWGGMYCIRGWFCKSIVSKIKPFL